MNFIQKIQKLFNTDKWWGRVSLLLLFYLIYFMLGYWIWFIFPDVECFNCDFYLMSWISPLYFFLFLPVLSLFFIFKINKKLNLKINKVLLFFINLIIVLINLFLFYLLLINSIQPNFF